jgi:hypothetical protein
MSLRSHLTNPALVRSGTIITPATHPPRVRLNRRRWWSALSRGCRHGQARGLMTAWLRWERISRQLWPLQPIAAAPHGLLRIAPKRYRGPRLRLPDGDTLERGDWIAELHCENVAIVACVNRRLINRYRACREDLAALARWLRDSPDGARIKGVCGVTLLWPAAHRLGFVVAERSGRLRNHLDRIYMGGLLLIYSSDGPTRAQLGRTLDRYPRMVWLSRSDLIRLYAPRAACRNP